MVSDNKISYTLYPTRAIRKGGVNNIINVAVAEALEANDADVLVAPEYTIVSKRNFFFRTKVKEITVTGFPAKIKNFRNATPEEISILEAVHNQDCPNGVALRMKVALGA